MNGKFTGMGEVFYDELPVKEGKKSTKGLTAFFVMENFNAVLFLLLKIFLIPLIAALVISMGIGGGFVSFYILCFIIVICFYIFMFVKKYNEMRT